MSLITGLAQQPAHRWIMRVDSTVAVPTSACICTGSPSSGPPPGHGYAYQGGFRARSDSVIAVIALVVGLVPSAHGELREDAGSRFHNRKICEAGVALIWPACSTAWRLSIAANRASKAADECLAHVVCACSEVTARSFHAACCQADGSARFAGPLCHPQAENLS